MVNEMRRKARDFGPFLERTVGKVGYLNGTRGEICTRAMIDYRLGSIRFANYWDKMRLYAPQWIGMIVADCSGWYEMFMCGGDIGKPLTSFMYEDIETFYMQARAVEFGLPNDKIATLPRDCPYPIAVGYPGHVGFFYKGKVFQSAGHQPGTVVGTLESTVWNKVWTDWYMLPFLDYEGWRPQGFIQQGGDEIMLSRNFTATAAVYDYQVAVKKLGYEVGKFTDMYDKVTPNGLDGKYGETCEGITKQIQQKYGLPVTGNVDAATYGKVLQALVTLQPSVTGVPQATYDGVVNQLTAKTSEVNTLNAKVTELQTATSSAVSQLNATNSKLVTLNSKIASVKDSIKKLNAFSLEA